MTPACLMADVMLRAVCVLVVVAGLIVLRPLMWDVLTLDPATPED